MKPRIIISGGGTGGHIFPALAIADELKAQLPTASLLFVGAYNRMEMHRVPKAGYSIKGLWISGFDRKNMIRNILFPIKLGWSLLQALFIVLKFRPNVVVGTGGFASGPLVFVASLLRIPAILQEQNAYPGVTNKQLASRVNTICLGSDAAMRFFPTGKTVVTGNPVRKALHESLSRTTASTVLGVDPQAFTLLVLGGSLGARKINQLVKNHLPDIKKHNVQLIWQCGNLYAEEYQSLTSESIHVVPFIDNMSAAYAASYLVVSRAGALAISELCLTAKPTLFVPSPNFSENHQEKNAQALVDKEAAFMVVERHAEAEFWPILMSLIESESLRNTLSKNIKTFAHPNATKEIVSTITQHLPTS